jgi:outer membrane protein OmpA-like peptidoglycan-associated protein
MRMHIVLAVLGFVGLSGPVAADPAYNAADIVNLFAAEAETGATRGICIGTEAECGGTTTEVTPSPTFDLLVTFGLDSDQLTPEAQQNLDEFAKALQDPRLGSATFAVEGHTDASGTDDYNMTLSQRRAAAVVQYLNSKGVEAAKLVPKGFGEAQPKAGDPLDPENRRVETRIVVQ